MLCQAGCEAGRADEYLPVVLNNSFTNSLIAGGKKSSESSGTESEMFFL